jgi:hypothetical protein
MASHIFIRGEQLTSADLEVIQFPGTREVWLIGEVDDLPEKLRGEYAPGVPTDTLTGLDFGEGERFFVVDTEGDAEDFIAFDLVAKRRAGRWRIRLECERLVEVQ